MTTHPSPSKQCRSLPGPYFEWHLNGRWVKFHIKHSDVDNPGLGDTDLIGRVVRDDHLEELYQLGNQFFRYAGGGRGFYWTDELEVVT